MNEKEIDLHLDNFFVMVNIVSDRVFIERRFSLA